MRGAVRSCTKAHRNIPKVSVVVPCRNEEAFIRKCLDSIVGNDYPKDRLEVLVIDGMSEDGTRSIIETYTQEHPWIRLLDNPARITSAALNRGLQTAKGEMILWMSAHNEYERDYIFRCVEGLQQYEADNVGGIIKTVPRRKHFIGWAIVKSLSHPFGVGNSYFRVRTDKPKWVDTVFGGCYRRDIFERVGYFNEALVRGQDMEFNLRLKKKGGRTLLIPHIVSTYYAPSDIKTFIRHNVTNGFWAIMPFLYSDIMPVSFRHLIPLLFVGGLLITAGVGLFYPFFLWISLAIGVSYVGASVVASCHIAFREKEIRYFFIMPFVFGMLHIGYGLGSLWGILKLMRAGRFWRKLFSLWSG